MPFDVVIQSETLVVMDTHAHMSTTEVIGLLGGNYSHDSRKLKVIALVMYFFQISGRLVMFFDLCFQVGMFGAKQVRRSMT